MLLVLLPVLVLTDACHRMFSKGHLFLPGWLAACLALFPETGTTRCKAPDLLWLPPSLPAGDGQRWEGGTGPGCRGAGGPIRGPWGLRRAPVGEVCVSWGANWGLGEE